MDEIFHTFYANGALLVMWGALLFHLILPIPRSAHPVTLWHKFAETLADKVNTNASYAQSQLSGTLAWLLMILPTVVVCVALKPLVWQTQLFELALLLLALDWRSQEQLANRMASALAKDDKKLARSLLMPYVNRDTSTLSPLGLGKAGAETVIMALAAMSSVCCFGTPCSAELAHLSIALWWSWPALGHHRALVFNRLVCL